MLIISFIFKSAPSTRTALCFVTRTDQASILLLCRGLPVEEPAESSERHPAALPARLRRRSLLLELQSAGRTGRLAERRLPDPPSGRQLHHHVLPFT